MKTVLITGANRGIGFELTRAYIQKGWRVIAAVRDPNKMPEVKGGEVVVVKLDAGEKEDAKNAVKELEDKGITAVDVIIANAAINLSHDIKFIDVNVDHQDEIFKINVRGPLLLFQATLGLLSKNGVFATVSSDQGTIDRKHGDYNSIYGQSKAAVNFFIKKIHHQHPEIITLALHPGWVPTEMGNEGAKSSGLEQAPDKFSETIPGMIKVIEQAERDTTSGRMVNWDGKIMNW